MPITLTKADDSTLVTIVPDVAGSAVPVVVTLGSQTGTATVAIAPGEAIADPAGQLTSVFAQTRATLATKPAGMRASDWVTDSAQMSALLVAAADSLARATPAQRLAAARIINDLLSGGAASAADRIMPAAPTAARSVPGRTAVVLGATSTRAMSAACVAAGVKATAFAAVAVAAAPAVGLLGPLAPYVGALAVWKTVMVLQTEVAQYCFAETGVVANPGLSTLLSQAVDVEAEHRPLSEDDVPVSATARIIQRASANITRAAQGLASLGARLTAPTEAIDQPSQVTDQTEYAVSPADVALEPLTVNGEPVSLSASGTSVVLSVPQPPAQPTSFTATLDVADGDLPPVRVTVAGTLGTALKVVLSPHAATIDSGRTLPFTAIVTDTAGNPVGGHVVSWLVTDTHIATVSSAGVVTALKPGQTSLVAISPSVKPDTAVISVPSAYALYVDGGVMPNDAETLARLDPLTGAITNIFVEPSAWNSTNSWLELVDVANNRAVWQVDDNNGTSHYRLAFINLSTGAVTNLPQIAGPWTDTPIIHAASGNILYVYGPTGTSQTNTLARLDPLTGATTIIFAQPASWNDSGGESGLAVIDVASNRAIWQVKDASGLHLAFVDLASGAVTSLPPIGGSWSQGGPPVIEAANGNVAYVTGYSSGSGAEELGRLDLLTGTVTIIFTAPSNWDVSESWPQFIDLPNNRAIWQVKDASGYHLAFVDLTTGAVTSLPPISGSWWQGSPPLIYAASGH